MKSLFPKYCILLALLAFVIVSTGASKPRHRYHQKQKTEYTDANDMNGMEIVTVGKFETMTIISTPRERIGYRVNAFHIALDKAYGIADKAHYKILPGDVKITRDHGNNYITLMGVNLIAVTKYDAQANHETVAGLAKTWQKNLAVAIPKSQPLNWGESSAVF